MNARRRYNELQSERSQFLDVANQCAELTLPYLMKNEETLLLTHHSRHLGNQSVLKLWSPLHLN